MKKMMILLVALSLLVPVAIEPSRKITQTYISKQVKKAKDFITNHKKTSFIVVGAMSLLTVGGMVKFALYFSEKKTNVGESPRPELPKVETQHQEEILDDQKDTIAEKESVPSKPVSQEPSKKYQEKKEIKTRGIRVNQKEQKDEGDEVEGYEVEIYESDEETTIIKEDIENKPSEALAQLVLKDELRRLALDSRSKEGPEIEAKNDPMTQEIIDAILKDPENKIKPEDIQQVIEIVGGVTPDNPKLAIQISTDGLSNDQLSFLLKHVKQLAHKKNLTDSLSIRTSEAGYWQEESLAMKFEGDFPAFKGRPQIDVEPQKNKKESEVQATNEKLNTDLYNFLSTNKINMKNTTIITERNRDQITVNVHGNKAVFGKNRKKFETTSVHTYLKQWADQQKKDSIKGVRIYVYDNGGKTYEDDKSLFTVLL